MDKTIICQDRNGVACPKCGTQCEFGLIVELGTAMFHNTQYSGDSPLMSGWDYDIDNYEVLGEPKRLWCAVCGFEVDVEDVKVITVPDSPRIDKYETECAACKEDLKQVARLMGLEKMPENQNG